ncbi:hypothetical protein KAR91_07230 [Candidatus Pacearchaeota archaeon]|nr:hypothetical protein [Candidatus Pacearchaeota archaeon]
MQDRKVVNADKVADYFIWLTNENRLDITNMQVQALLFLCQCKHLFIHKKVMFHDRIKTFKEGFVAVPKVHNRLKDKGTYLTWGDKYKPLFSRAVEGILTKVYLTSMIYPGDVLMRFITESDTYKKTRETRDKFIPILLLNEFFKE